MKSGRTQWQKAEETRKHSSTVLILQEKLCISELSMVIQDATLLILLLKDNVIIPNDFFEYICQVGCAINLHSITNSGLTPRRQNLSKRQTVFLHLWIQWTKKTEDPNNIDLEAPRLAWYHQTAWKKHQNTLYWVDIKLAHKKGFKFYQTRSNATILCNTLLACCIPKAIKMETGEIIYEKKYMRHPGLLRIFPLKTIGCRNWVQKLLDMVKTQQIQPKSKKKKDKDADENVHADQVGTATRWKWTIYRFVHTTWGNRHRLQNAWIATCSCETSRKLPCSRTREEEQESPPLTSASSRSVTK